MVNISKGSKFATYRQAGAPDDDGWWANNAFYVFYEAYSVTAHAHT